MRPHVYVAMPTAVRSVILFRYYLKGANAGSVDIFADNLPLLPDNIRPSQSGGYWIGSSIPRGQGFSLIESLTTSPWVRNTMAQVRIEQFISDVVMQILGYYRLVNAVKLKHCLGELREATMW